MNEKKRILAISGSTRTRSANGFLIKAISEISQDIFTIEVYNSLAELPHFNPDLDNDNPPLQVTNFRNKLKKAEGILICTPEYAMGVPGSLKNAIDWTVSSCEFSKKPTALITASSSGLKGHASLLESLRIIEAQIADDAQLVISYVKIKISDQGIIIDDSTLTQVKKLISALNELLRSN